MNAQKLLTNLSPHKTWTRQQTRFILIVFDETFEDLHESGTWPKNGSYNAREVLKFLKFEFFQGSGSPTQMERVFNTGIITENPICNDDELLARVTNSFLDLAKTMSVYENFSNLDILEKLNESQFSCYILHNHGRSHGRNWFVAGNEVDLWNLVTPNLINPRQELTDIGLFYIALAIVLYSQFDKLPF